jgi:hypothetical protein
MVRGFMPSPSNLFPENTVIPDTAIGHQRLLALAQHG